jgi:hypothetical protein
LLRRLAQLPAKRFPLTWPLAVISFAIILSSLVLSAPVAQAATLTLTWKDNSTGQARFDVERKIGSGGLYGQIAQLPMGSSSYVDTSVVAGTTYCYRVRAVNDGGVSGYSNEACASSAGELALTVVRAGAGIGTVSSSPPGIDCGPDCSERYPEGTVVTLTTAAAEGSTFSGWSGGGCAGTDPCVVTGNTAVAVTATFVTVPPPEDTTPPSPPGALAATAIGPRQINLAWGPSIDTVGVTGYRVERCEGVGCSAFVQIASPVTRALSDTGLAPSTSYSYRVRATDAKGNLSNYSNIDSAATTAVVAASCPCTIWPSSARPSLITDPDTKAVELGVKFSADVDGFITGIRFYKGPQNTGTHRGHLWTTTGKLLATVTFRNETSSGWQQATFSTPVPISANTVYIASYHTRVGRYSANTQYFSTKAVDTPPLHALVGQNGVYRYGSSGFPTQTYRSSNYWVDVIFMPR